MQDHASPQAAMPPVTGALLGANALIYALMAVASGGLDIDPRLIAQTGGLVPVEWLDGAWWRLLTAGFLHFGLMHLMANGICLLAWGVPLERFFGSARMLVLFLGAIIAGSATSLALHDDPFIGAGASGGVSGLLGALLLLRLTGFASLPGSFFVINIGLNVAIALFAPGIDWQAHLGGFLGGMMLAFLMQPRFRG